MLERNITISYQDWIYIFISIDKRFFSTKINKISHQVDANTYGGIKVFTLNKKLDVSVSATVLQAGTVQVFEKSVQLIVGIDLLIIELRTDDNSGRQSEDSA